MHRSFTHNPCMSDFSDKNPGNRLVEANTSPLATPPQSAEVRIPRLVSKEVTLEGDPQFGTVHHLGLVHRNLHGNTREELIVIGEHRFALLKQLHALGVSTCFLEGNGHDEDVKAGAIESLKLAEKCLAVFPTREFPTEINTEQALALGTISARDSIAYFFPAVKLFGAEPDEQTYRQAKRSIHDDAGERAWTFDVRDKAALSAVCRYLDQNPKDNSVALIYGGAHVYETNSLPTWLNGREGPFVLKYTFENLSQYALTVRVRDAADPATQLEEVAKCRDIFEWAFCKARSIEVQAAMLPKLRADVDFHPTPELLRAALEGVVLQEEGSERVLALIQEAFKSSSGPFADLVPRPNAEAVLTGALSDFADLYVYDELHPFTQLLIIRNAPFLLSYCFSSILTETGQIEALGKIRRGSDENVDDLRAYLFDKARTAVVKEEIQRRWKTSEAPFD
jgi:hypothetical protein